MRIHTLDASEHLENAHEAMVQHVVDFVRQALNVRAADIFNALAKTRIPHGHDGTLEPNPGALVSAYSDVEKVATRLRHGALVSPAHVGNELRLVLTCNLQLATLFRYLVEETRILQGDCG